MTVLDLFSGIGGFSLAAHRIGFEVIAHCEIEPFCQAVLKKRFPKIPIFEDVKYITQKSFYEKTGQKTVDIICGGSPCQDLSVAGKQYGLEGDRSGLFFEQIRIARELSAKYIVWENFPGALSSNGGGDFARILSEFTGWQVAPRKWGGAGYLQNCKESDYSVCYRILDTRFFRIPQRRRRIYLVASLGKPCSPEVLFECESMQGYFKESGKKRENITAFTEGSFGTFNKSRLSATIKASGGVLGGGSETLIYENHPQDGRCECKTVSPTLTSRMGTGGGNVPLCVHASQDPIVSNKHSHALGANSTMAVCVAENVIGRKVNNGGNGVGAKEEISYTLNTVGVHGVAKDLSVRRLTPVECERLQGFPDGWTEVEFGKAKNDLCSDSHRYRALGNAITVDVGQWVLSRLKEYITLL